MFSTTRGQKQTKKAGLQIGSLAAVLDAFPAFVYKYIGELDTDKRAYGWLPLMASCSGGQIGALCAENFCKRILSEANDVCYDGNTLLDTEESTCWLCYVLIENSYNTCVKSNPS